MIRIILVDDHNLVREALRVVLEQGGGMQVVGEAANGEAVLRLLDETATDVVVMDVSMPGPSGIEITRRLLEKHPEIKVLALSTYLDRRVVQKMLDAGAHGYIVKSAAGAELKQGIRSVIEGRSYLCNEVTALVTDSLRVGRLPTGKPASQTLSTREVQVVKLLAEGMTTGTLAEELHISPNTVEVHRRNILRKLELNSVVDLTRYAIRTGLIQP